MNKVIYVADDEQDILDVLQEFLTNAGYDIKTFLTGDDLFSEFREKPCDLVILDIMMPGTDGLSVCKMIREISDVPVVILTAKESESDQIRGYMTGGDDYLVKPFSPSLLVVKIKALLRRSGTAVSPKEGVKAYDIVISDAVQDALYEDKQIGLTTTEFALIKCLSKEPGTAVSRNRLLDDVWGIDAEEVETRVVDETVRRIRGKLRKAGCKTKISAVWGYGYKLEAANE